MGLKDARTLTAVTTTGTLGVAAGVVDELRAGEVTVVQLDVLIADLPAMREIVASMSMPRRRAARFTRHV